MRYLSGNNQDSNHAAPYEEYSKKIIIKLENVPVCVFYCMAICDHIYLIKILLDPLNMLGLEYDPHILMVPYSSFSVSITDPNNSVPDTPTSPGDVHLATSLTQHMISKQRTWFCSFCSGQPYHHQHLQDHLEELSQVKNEIYSKFKHEKCPVLSAKQTQLLALNLVQQNSWDRPS